MKKVIPRISEAEWVVMKVIWDQSPILAQGVIDPLIKKGGWHSKTVKTLLGRLVKKGALEFRKEGRSYWYSPIVNEEDCIREEGRTFMKRFFNGAFQPMLAHFVEQEKLTPQQIEELKNILNKKGN